MYIVDKTVPSSHGVVNGIPISHDVRNVAV